MVDWVRAWSVRGELPVTRLLGGLGVAATKHCAWRQRYGRVNEHNHWMPRDRWLETWEQDAIAAFQTAHPLDGYRRLTYMMLDTDVVAVSPASVYRGWRPAGCSAGGPAPRRRMARAFAARSIRTGIGTWTWRT